MAAKKIVETKQEDARPKYGFVKVKCHECGTEATVYGRSATEIKCKKCSEVIVIPRGGKSAIKAEILELL